MESKIQSFLAYHDIDYAIEEHEPVFTVAESMAVIGDKTPVKNLLLKEEKGDRLVFVIMHGLKRLDTKLVATELGCKKLQFAKPDVLFTTLGVTPGSASLFSLLHEGASGVSVVIDKELLESDKLGFHPNTNDKTYIVSGNDVQKIIAALNVNATVLSLA